MNALGVKLLAIAVLLILSPLQVLSAQALAEPADGELTSIVESLESRQGESTILSLEQFALFLNYASEHRLNLFELLNLVYPLLAERDQRYIITGPTIQETEKEFYIGGSKIRLILPIDSVIRMEIGKSFGPDQHALDVYITEHYSADFFGFGMLHEEPHFGFKEIRLNYYNEAFGMYAKRMFFTFDVSYLHLYDGEEVAIHMKNFFKPKREVFDAVWKKK